MRTIIEFYVRLTNQQVFIDYENSQNIWFWHVTQRMLYNMLASNSTLSRLSKGEKEQITSKNFRNSKLKHQVKKFNNKHCWLTWKRFQIKKKNKKLIKLKFDNSFENFRPSQRSHILSFHFYLNPIWILNPLAKLPKLTKFHLTILSRIVSERNVWCGSVNFFIR